MDSRLLNVFHDDPFDGSFVKYDDNNADFWSSGSESLGLQLAETLHGILPLAPTEDVSVLYGNTILKDDYTLESKDDAVAAMQTKNALIYDDFAEHHVAAGGAIEIVTVNPDGEDSESDINDAAHEDFDTRSQRSYVTFRSRTDSSSIGDYESHSSDYDDDDDDVYNNDDDNDDENDDVELMENTHGHYMHVPELSNSAAANISNFKLPLETTPKSKSKNRTLSTNTIGSDVDGLGLQIDASTFDLAEFITKDDFAMANSTSVATNKKCYQTINTRTQHGPVSIHPEAAPVQIISSHNADSDSDSDVIVDVETVEYDVDEENQLWSAKLNAQIELPENNMEDLVFEDNINSDPSWSPVAKTNHKKEITINETKSAATASSPPSPPPNQTNHNQQLQQNFPRSFSVVPSKRQCDFLKGKFGSGRAKITTLQQRNLKTGASKTIDTKLELVKTPKKEQIAEETNTRSAATGKHIAKPAVEIKNLHKIGVGQGGKNLSLIKHDRYSISEQSSEENFTPQKECKVLEENEKLPSELPQINSVKRKLNLEEYKKRIGERNGDNVSTNNSPSCKTLRLEKVSLKNQQQNSAENKTHPTLQKSCHNGTNKTHTEVASIVQSLKAQATQPPKPPLDPITEAKNKVLRMQELKKAQLLKIIDSTVSAKVPRVTKMLPLKDMVTNAASKNTAIEHSNKNASKANDEYEEIVIVSASCNTIISIPPINILPNCQQDAGALKLGVNNASRSLLKSSALLYNISNTFQKVQASENVKLTSNSLITSIQGVVAKQTSSTSSPAEHQVATPTTTTTPLGVVNRSSHNGTTVIIAKNASNAEQHGEDKIIMHLRKDRMRNPTCSASMQTDFLAEFPPLPPTMSNNAVDRKSRERKRRKRAARNYRVRTDLEFPDRYHKESGSDVSSCFEAGRSYRSRSRSCSRDGSLSSTERLRRSDGVGAEGYSSRSSRRHRSSISSSYSEAERKPPVRRSRKSHYKSRSSKKYARSSSNSSTEFSDRSRSRSRSPLRRSRSRSCSKRSFVDRNVSQPAVEERRIVYVGRIEQETTKEMLRRKFIAYGPIKQITIHYKDTGMKYGFVTYERSQDAFNVIDNSARDSHINMYDISFGGRRAFCRASYADLDNAGINTYQSYVFPQATPAPKEEDSFEALLLKVKAKMNASKMSTNTTTNTTTKI